MRAKIASCGTIPIAATLLTILLAACGSSQPAREMTETSAQDTAAYQEAIVLSGESEAATALAQRLRTACHIPDMSSSSIPELQTSGLMPSAGEEQGLDLVALENAEDCVRSRVIVAFEAEEGEPYCRHRADIVFFINCIVSGAYAARVARNFGINSLSAENLWSDAIEPGRRINEAFFRKALDKCQRRSQWEANNCAEDILLPALEISRSDISNCPSGKMRGTCIGKTGIAHFVHEKLVYIF